jgi:hypothetical protein
MKFLGRRRKVLPSPLDGLVQRDSKPARKGPIRWKRLAGVTVANYMGLAGIIEAGRLCVWCFRRGQGFDLPWWQSLGWGLGQLVGVALMYAVLWVGGQLAWNETPERRSDEPPEYARLLKEEAEAIRCGQEIERIPAEKPPGTAGEQSGDGRP